MTYVKGMSCALGAIMVAAFALSVSAQQVQQPYGPNDAPNLYRFTYGWAKLPDRRKFGAVVGVDVDRDGKSIWAFDRCESATDCSKSNLDPIMKFDETGKLVKSFGGGMINYSHGFNVPHNLAMDSAGRLFVADRANNRVQVFDQDGKYLFDWKQFGRPSGLFIDKNDMLYVADNSPDETNPPFRSGIRVGSVKDGVVIAFILESVEVNGVEAVAVDDAGNIYGGYTNTLNLRRWTKKETRVQR